VVLDLGLVAGSDEVVEGECGGEIDECARDGGYRDAVPGRGIEGVCGAGAVGDDALDASFPGRLDLRRRRRALEKAKEMARGVSAETRPLPARQHGRRVAGLHARSPVPHAVHARELDEQRAALQAPVDLLRRKACIEELRPRDHAVLPPGDPGHFLMSHPTLTPHMGV
jgi:hypothetical protein